MKVLVCGGCGYIGCHLVRYMLRQAGTKPDKKFEVVVLDSLAVYHNKMPNPKEDGVIAYEIGDVRDVDFLDSVFTKHRPDAVVHMCASIVVPDSVRDPLGYYDNNVIGAIRLLQVMKKHNCQKLVFSSTAALFGDWTAAGKDNQLIPPDAPKAPTSPYGETKLITEWLMADAARAYGLRFVSLRYFNACGAAEEGDIGECHDPESHLIPLVLRVAGGKSEKIFIFGDDYPTPDGTCVRDYIHINDLADAHVRALWHLQKLEDEKAQPEGIFLNLGVGNGFSVKEVIEESRKVTGHPIPAEIRPRRPGDPPILVASAAAAKEVLGWVPKYNLNDIIKSAWSFHKRRWDEQAK